MESSGADTINMNQGSNIVTLNNSGTITDNNSNGTQAIDFTDITSGSNTVNNAGGASITAKDGDAIRPGAGGIVNNDGTIQGKTVGDSGNDGIDVSDFSGVVITNALNNVAANANLIEGASHGIAGGGQRDQHHDDSHQ